MVRINDELLKKCTFTEDLGSVKELTLTNKEVEDVKGVQSLVGLSDLNLAFNRIKNLSSLGSMGELRYLNVMHNQVRSLQGVGALTSLRVLKVSDNQISSLEPLSQLTMLEELWVHNNEISDLKELEHLRPMTNLSHLWLLPNPCCSKLPPREYRRLLLLMVPSLKVVDTKLITAEEKEVLDMLTEVERMQAAKEIQQRNDLGLQREKKLKEESLGQYERQPKQEKQKKGGKFLNKKKTNQATSRKAKGPASTSTSSATNPHSNLAHGGVGGGLGTSDLLATMSNMLPNFEPSKEQLELLGKPEGRGRFVGLVNRGKPKHSNGVTVKTTIKCRAALSDPKAHLVEYEAKYPGSSIAVVVHHDGSAFAKWPGEQLAIIVDSDVLDTANGKQYSLFATYRSTRVIAISFDVLGNGFVNFPNGQALLSYSAEKDRGVQYDPKGKIVREWSKKDSANISHSVEVVLDANLAFRHRMPEGIPEVYFACNTVRQKLIQGYNPASKVWEDEHDPDAPSFLPDMNFKNPLADSVKAVPNMVSSSDSPSKKKKKMNQMNMKSSSSFSPSKSAKKTENLGLGDSSSSSMMGPGISLSSISSLTDSLQKLNSDLLNGSILKS